MDIPNELRSPEDLYEKKGGLIITNISADQTITSIEVKDENGDVVDPGKIMLLNTEGTRGVIEPAGSEQWWALDPGTYTFTAKYSDGTQLLGQKIHIELRTYKYLTVTSEPIELPTGILQVINLSGTNVISVKVNNVEILKDPIADQGSYSVSRDPGDYKVQVQIKDEKNSLFEKTVQIVEGNVTNILVFKDGMNPSETGTGTGTESNNLWVLNRTQSSIVTSVDIKSGTGSYSPLPSSEIPIRSGKIPIVSEGYMGTYLDPKTYVIQVVLDTKIHIPPIEGLSVEMTKEPVFLIVRDGSDGRPEIDVLTGDADGDGFPNWWEEKYFPDDINNRNLPGKEKDADGDKLSNWDEYLNGTDPTKKDSDGDGLSDWEEVNGQKDPNFSGRPSSSTTADVPDTFPKTDPRPGKKDTDADGLTDWEEITGKKDPTIPGRPKDFPDTFAKTNPLDPDSDWDGVTDYVEIRDGTDPNYEKSRPGRIEIVVPWGN